MLLRASRRSLRHDAYKQATATIEGIHLPFLCPPLYVNPTYSKCASSSVPSRSKAGLHDPKALTTANTPSNRRHLASAAAIEYSPNLDYHVPFDSGLNPVSNHSPRFDAQQISALRPFDPATSPIIINDALSTHPRKFRAKDAISGNLNEIHQNLHACLQVGRLERAAALMRRLNQIYKPGAPGLLAAHNEYVKEISYRISQTRDQHLFQHLQRWFFVDVKEAGVKPDAETYAWMIQASAHASGSTRYRTVRRYINLAKEADLYDETIDQLNDFQKDMVCQAHPIVAHLLKSYY